MTDGVDPLRVEEVSVSFGGLRALDDVSLRVPAGGIIGLIGPNGAGKTTLFNAVTGAVDPVRGAVWLFGQDVTRWAPHNRARLGVGRTIQRLELFGSLTVKENLVVAAESHAGRGGLLSGLLALPASIETRAAAEERATAVLAELGLDGHADAVAGELPTGLCRLVELGRALCTEPRLLLLDEPSSGLRAQESRELGAYLRGVRERGTSVLVVEHDMRFVLGLCDYVYVLDFGRLLAEGTPAEVRGNPAVRAAYLGDDTDGAGRGVGSPPRRGAGAGAPAG